jgi:hypothetical protein
MDITLKHYFGTYWWQEPKMQPTSSHYSPARIGQTSQSNDNFHIISNKLFLAGMIHVPLH